MKKLYANDWGGIFGIPLKLYANDWATPHIRSKTILG